MGCFHLVVGGALEFAHQGSAEFFVVVDNQYIGHNRLSVYFSFFSCKSSLMASAISLSTSGL